MSISIYNPPGAVITTGTYSITGGVSQVLFPIPHGLTYTPSFFTVTPTISFANGLHSVTADGTNINVTFTVAPGAKTVSFVWLTIK